MRTKTLLLFLGVVLWAVTIEAAEDILPRVSRVAVYELNTSSFSQIQALWGKTELRTTGETADFEARLCYVSSTYPWAIDFLTGELGILTDPTSTKTKQWHANSVGDDYLLLGYRLREKLSSDLACTATPIDMASLLPIEGVYLGMPKKAFHRAMAQHVSFSRKKSDYILERNILPAALENHETPSQVLVTITPRCRWSRLVAFELWEITSH